MGIRIQSVTFMKVTRMLNRRKVGNNVKVEMDKKRKNRKRSWTTMRTDVIHSIYQNEERFTSMMIVRPMK